MIELYRRSSSSLFTLLITNNNNNNNNNNNKIDYLQTQEYEYQNIYPMYILLVYERELS